MVMKRIGSASKENEKIDFSKIEKKWQAAWEKKKVFVVDEGSKGKKKYYVLEMYPYPSGSGLHIGHAFNYTLGDILARFKRMNGFNVLYPMGYDSFGLPAENAAIKSKLHPKVYTNNAIKNFIKQQKSLGFSYDWSRKIESHDVEYYKWDQYFFLKLLENGLVYRKKALVNYCERCKSVLANEQVHNGKCWVHKETDIETKPLEQWFIRTTKYADELLQRVRELDWPERIKIMQENWIGKSHGIEIDFEINKERWSVFTTRPDTLFGVTFMVISAQHPSLFEIVKEEQRIEVEEFLKKVKSTKQEDMDLLEKEGVFTGSYAVNPINGEKVPVYVGNFVVADYGSGMVMAVPAHDQRDFEFAKKYGLDIRVVIQPNERNSKKLTSRNMTKAYESSGDLVNSEAFNDLFSEEAKEHILKALEFKKKGRKSVQFKLRDWLISRQRYWGTPIPIIYCEKCGIVPVPEGDLPVKLPEKVKFGEGNPLLTAKEWVKVSCPKCKSAAKRETDTMDTFFESSWYFLRYCDAKNDKKPFADDKVKYWMPVDFYVGGAEHACMHLIYARFFTKALRDLGFLKFDEPFTKLFNQGMVHGEDGAVMSKSRGNVIDPLDISKRHGADTLRMFLVSMASPDKDSVWSNTGIESTQKFLIRAYSLMSNIKLGKSSSKTEHKINKAIREITKNIEGVRYNIALIELRNLINSIDNEIDKKDAEKIIKILTPFCPHVAEEIWERIGGKGFVSLADWPKVDESKIDQKIEEAEKNVEKTVSDILNVLKILREKQDKDGEKIYLYVIPNEFESYNAELLSKKLGKEVIVFKVNDKNKVDPENRASKAKPGKPGIYVK